MTLYQFAQMSLFSGYLIVVIVIVALVIKAPFGLVQYQFWNWVNKRFKSNVPIEELTFINLGIRALGFAIAFMVYAYQAGSDTSGLSSISPNFASLSLICFIPGLIGVLCDAAIMAWKQKKVTPLFGLLSISINALASAYSLAAVSYISTHWSG